MVLSDRAVALSAEPLPEALAADFDTGDRDRSERIRTHECIERHAVRDVAVVKPQADVAAHVGRCRLDRRLRANDEAEDDEGDEADDELLGAFPRGDECLGDTQPGWCAADTGPIMDSKPVVYVPRSNEVSRMIEVEALSVTPRAQRVGVCVIAPRMIKPAELMASCMFWPKQLAVAGVKRVGVVLSSEAFLQARPILTSCRCRMAEFGVAIEYFHEGHLESDQIAAWFEQRKPRRRVTSDSLIKLGQRYAERGDIRSAANAVRLAELIAA